MYAIIENNVVTGLINYETDNSIPVDNSVDIGDVYLDGKFIKVGINFDPIIFKDLSKEEILKKIEELKQENNKNKIKQYADSLIKKELEKLDYSNLGEVALYAGNPNSKWYYESRQLQKWIEEIYHKMYELIEKNYNGELKDVFPKFEG